MENRDAMTEISTGFCAIYGEMTSIEAWLADTP